MTLPTPELALKNTMQAPPDALKDGAFGAGFWAQYTRNPILSPFGTRRREQDLRRLWRHDYNTAIRGAFVGIATEFAGKKYKISGPETLPKESAKYYRASAKALNMQLAPNKREDIAYWDAIFRYADFGRGWASFVQKFVLDYLRQDAGAVVEIIAPGAATKAPTGAVSGLSVLDSLRCIPTGDPEYPIVYWNRKAEYHLIHKDRMLHFQDMPDSDELTPGYGMCALSRSIAVAYREVLMAQYLEAQLDDKPPPGIIYANNMNEAVRDKMLALYRKDQISADVTPEWGKLMWAFSLDASSPLKIEMLQFSTPPEKFDWKTYTELDIDLLALAIGVDRQDLWQLSGGSSGMSGSAGQSKTLAQKSRGKMKGLLYAEITRKINSLLPDEMEFEWEERDTEAEAEHAANATAWAGVATALAMVLSPDQQLTLVANNSEEVRDVVTDENGNIQSIEDGDVQTAQQIADDAAAAHALELQTTPPPVDPNKPTGKPVSGSDRQPVRKELGLDADVGRVELSTVTKAIQATRIDFEDDFTDLIKSRIDDTVTGVRFGILARAMLRKYGLRALRDGLEDGGVRTYDSEASTTPLEPDEQAIFDQWLVEQSVYVTNFGAELKGGSQPNAEDRAGIWANKSLMVMYNEGLNSANENAMLEFVGDDGVHTCKTCARLKGQIHRSKAWKRKKLRPQIDTEHFICGGWQCKHTLMITRSPAKGSF